ncbi:MAG: TRAP transporter small permease [Rhodospirillales bacterium]|nr:TRAP transporter small permease [Rhodospirillales bacterium]
MRNMSPFARAARPFGLVASALLVLLMVHTTVAVLARQLLGLSMMSLVEVSELALIGIIFIAMPGAFLRDENIVVDVIDNLVPKKVSRFLYLLGLVMTLTFLVVAAYAMIEPATAMFNRTQTTMVMEIDRFYHWMPILFGFYLAIAATILVLVYRLRSGASDQ